MTTTTRTNGAGYSITHADTLYVCGGSTKCPTTDGLTHTIVTSPNGLVRCQPCADRLDWKYPR